MHQNWQTFAHPLGGPLSVEQGREIGALVFLPRGASAFNFSSLSDAIAAQIFARRTTASSSTSSGGGGTPGGSSGQIQYNNSSAFGGFTASGDATINTSTGAVAVATVLGKTAIVSDGSVAFAAAQSMGSHKLTSVTDPTAAQDAATKAYVDAATAALISKLDCQGATTTALAAATYANGSSGVGATLTLTVAAVLILDGYTPALGDRLLIKNQSSAFQNGIYTLTTVGTIVINAVLTRATDLDQPSEVDGATTFIVNGSTNGGTRWQCLTSGTVVFGTTAINWSTFLGSTYTADETTLHLSGTVFSVLNGYDLFSVAVNADVAASSNSAVTLAYAKRTIVKATTYNGGTTPWTATLPTPALSGGKAQYLEIAVDPTSTKPYTLTANSGENIGPGTATTRRMFAGESAILRVNPDGATWTKVAGLTIPCACTMRLLATTIGGLLTYNTVVKILLDGVDADNTGLMADTTNHQITTQRSGLYVASGVVIFTNVSAGGLVAGGPRCITQIQKGGVGIANSESAGVATGLPSPFVTLNVALTAGDIMSLVAYQNTFSGTGKDEDAYGAPRTGGGADAASQLSSLEVPQW